MSGRNARSANALSELLALLLLPLLLREMQEDLLERRLRDREVVETDLVAKKNREMQISK